MDITWQTLQNAYWNLFHRLGFTDIVDILIVAVILYELLMLIRHTRGSAVMKGFSLLILVSLVSNMIGLTALNWLLANIVRNGALVLFILFQPELRHALEQIGRGAELTGRFRRDDADEVGKAVDGIVECCIALSRRRVGALIVIELKTGLNDFIETGTVVDAEISAPLLENIFEPNTPLHDGAVIIQDMRVRAAACILTLTENRNVSRELGTRHRAAIGVTESTDAISVIVSEETGIISYARAGEISRGLDEKALRELLDEVFERQDTLWNRLFHPRKGEQA